MITNTAASHILAKAQAFDRRNVTDAEVLVWAEALNTADPPIEEADALAAVTRWYATRGEGWIRPAHVIAGAHEVAELRRRLAREHSHQLAIEAAPLEAVGNRSERVKALLVELRGRLGPGRPDALRRPEWSRAERRREQAQRHAQPAIGGTGFCVPCYRLGRVMLAKDPVAGSLCASCEAEGKGEQ